MKIFYCKEIYCNYYLLTIVLLFNGISVSNLVYANELFFNKSSLNKVKEKKHFISIGSGSYTLKQSNQSFRLYDENTFVYTDYDLSINDESLNIIDLEYHYKLLKFMTLGSEFYHVENNYNIVSNGESGIIKSNFLTFKVKFHPRVTNWFSPYVAAQFGFFGTWVSGAVHTSDGGFALGLSAGMEFKIYENIGIHIKYKKIEANRFDYATKVALSGDGIFIGLSTYF